MGLDVSAHRIDNVPHRLPLLRSRGIAYRGAWRIAFHEDQPDRTQRFLLTDEHPHGLSDAVRLPYADCSFDCAIASGVLAGGSPSPGYQAPTWAGIGRRATAYGSTATGARQKATFWDCTSITLTWQVYRPGSSAVSGILSLMGCTLAWALKPSFGACMGVSKTLVLPR